MELDDLPAQRFHDLMRSSRGSARCRGGAPASGRCRCGQRWRESPARGWRHASAPVRPWERSYPGRDLGGGSAGNSPRSLREGIRMRIVSAGRRFAAAAPCPGDRPCPAARYRGRGTGDRAAGRRGGTAVHGVARGWPAAGASARPPGLWCCPEPGRDCQSRPARGRLPPTVPARTRKPRMNAEGG